LNPDWDKATCLVAAPWDEEMTAFFFMQETEECEANAADEV